MIKLLVSDMDGTLFEGHGKTLLDLSKRNEEALARIKDSPIKFCIATARTLQYGTKILEKYGFDNSAVAAFNGTIIYDQHEIVNAFTLDKQKMKQVLTRMIEINPKFSQVQLQGLKSNRLFYYLDTPDIPNYYKEISDIGFGKIMEDYTISNYLSDDQDIPFAKLSIMFKTMQETYYCFEILKEEFGQDFFITVSTKPMIEIVNKNGNKGVFIQYLKQTYHLLPEEIAVVGDAMNDLAMFKECATTFAMASGQEKVKESATYVVQDVAECIDICLELNTK